MMTRTRALVVIAFMLLSWSIATAQNDDEAGDPLLTLFSLDATRPVLFQPLGPGDTPQSRDFVSRLELDTADDSTIYISLENTGWSVGAIGAQSPEFSRFESYVALEMWLRVGNLTVRDDGAGFAFPLAFEWDLDGERASGFRLELLVAEPRQFRLFRVVEDGGVFIRARTPTQAGAFVELERVSYVIDPEPVFGDLLLDVHIIAPPIPESTPTDTPEALTPAPEAFE